MVALALVAWLVPESPVRTPSRLDWRGALGLSVGLVAGAWVDRLRRRPVMIWADLGRAALLGLIPLAAFGGWLSLPLLLLVTLLTAVLTTFFDTADNAFLPTIVPRADLVRANGALAATGSVSEFAAFGSAGFLVQILTAPIAITVNGVGAHSMLEFDGDGVFKSMCVNAL